ncbi:LuxR C-terminal-related transcriptional regulator [Ferrimonas balearica]|uniref:helix-turn-helix transcriptional regulator n=1 Tax=Ferrimonas balearica TaxID=44012 RepID=UPI001C59DC61|nr:LuxR C-terminal-related transcriptional regulator [Ferrimonas balearica]MBW3140553.1 LuxR C-terminal-related transcriptional regulator [Ferrimonas balearica]
MSSNSIDPTLPEICQVDEKWLSSLKHYLAQYGITEFHYGFTTRLQPESPHQFRKLYRRRPNEMIRAAYCVASSQRILQYRSRYLQHFAAQDQPYFNRHPMGLSVWDDPKSDSRSGPQLARLMEEYGLKSRGVWHLPTSYSPNWLAVFVFFSDQPREVLLRNLTEAESEIELQLTLYSSLLSEHFIAKLNPITNFNCISDRSLLILKLTAFGHSSAELATMLSLTESGVNYHLDRLKQLFNARNRTHLIGLAYRYGLIDSDDDESATTQPER